MLGYKGILEALIEKKGFPHISVSLSSISLLTRLFPQQISMPRRN
jgi:hypothetical protein